LNEVIVRFVDPMVMFTQSVVSHRRFKPGTKAAVEAHITSCKLAAPKDIPYAIGLSFDHPGCFVLYYQPGSSIHKDFITVTPNGLRYCQKVHDSADAVINYFKLHWKERLLRNAKKQISHSQYPSQGQWENPWSTSETPWNSSGSNLRSHGYSGSSERRESSSYSRDRREPRESRETPRESHRDTRAPRDSRESREKGKSSSTSSRDSRDSRKKL